jgi:type II secretory pathway component PulF
MDTLPPVQKVAAREKRLAACSTAQFAHSLWGLIHAGATLPQALDAIAKQRRADGDRDVTVFLTGVPRRRHLHPDAFF